MVERSQYCGLPLAELDGGNSLAFLAALGTLRTLTLAAPKRGIRMSWKEDRGAFRPVVHTCDSTLTEDEVVALLDNRLRSNACNEAFAWANNLNVAPDEFRRLAEKSTCFAHTEDGEKVHRRAWADFVAAFGCDATTRRQSKTTTIQDTALRTMSGAGHQHFLKFMRDIVDATDASHIRASLFAPWMYEDEGRGLNMRWDPEDDRRYALRWENPSTDPSKTVRGANRLAIEALPMLPCTPTCARLETTGFSVRAKEGIFWTWPVWRDPLTADGCQSLLALAELQQKAPDGQMLLELGILAAYRCQRINIGKFRNFTPAEVV